MDIFETVMLAIVAGVFLFIPVYGYVCHLISKKKMETGEDKRKIQDVLNAVIPAGESFTAAYAFWYHAELPKFSRYYKTTYWYYAIGFNENRIYIVPLKLEKGEIYYSGHSCIEKANVGRIESEPQYGKIKLFDRNNVLLAHLQVDDENNSSHGNGNINLYQKEEAKAFRELVKRWTAEINAGTSADNHSDEKSADTAETGISEDHYEDILKHTKKISHKDKKEILRLLNEGNKAEAMRKIQRHSGLGLADVAKVAEDPELYL